MMTAEELCNFLTRNTCNLGRLMNREIRITASETASGKYAGKLTPHKRGEKEKIAVQNNKSTKNIGKILISSASLIQIEDLSPSYIRYLK